MGIFSYSSRPRPSVDEHASGAMPYPVRRRARHARSAHATAHEVEYQNALRACSRIAKQEYDRASAALAGAQTCVAALSKNLEQADHRYYCGNRASEEAGEQIQALNGVLNGETRENIAAAQRALARKAQRLSQFTVTLFGRTMAGKSTIREAITGGDGSTIGKGAQRSTRDVREYDWNELRIVDTPGIGAYAGQADQASALSVVDESDLLLFLLSSDGIQESTFRGMRAVFSQNKPVLFVLNVKRNIEHGVYKRRLLRDPNRFLGDNAVHGHINRIRQLACDELGMRKVDILVIHAQAAFLATMETNTEAARQLHEASGIDNLLRALTDEVRQRGPIRRLQTLLDGTGRTLSDLEEFLHTQAKCLYGSARYLKDKFSELDVWLDGYIGSVNQRIEHEANVFFRPLRESVSTFIDDNLECADVSDRWTRRVEELGIENWGNALCQQLHEEVRARLAEFNREIEVDSELTGALRIAGPVHADLWDVRRALRWGSALSGALASAAGVAALIGESNFWNPVGWIAAFAGLAFIGLSWLFDDRQRRLQRHKASAARQLREKIDDMERRAANRVKGWFYKNITTRLVRGIRTDTRALCSGMFGIARELRHTRLAINDNVEQLHRRLLVKTGALLQTGTVQERDIDRLVRVPGRKTKFLWAGECAGDPAFCKNVGVALGERVDGIVAAGPAEMVAAALAPARVAPAQVRIDEDGAAQVRLPASEMGRAVGKHKHNVIAASQLLKRRIDIQGHSKV